MALSVCGILLGLVLVEQRHDLPDHVAHRVIAKLLAAHPDTLGCTFILQERK